MGYFIISKDEAIKLLENRSLTIAVIGQGKMGLPIDVVFLEAGYRVIGVDVNPETVQKINEGNPPIIGEPGVIEGIRKGLKDRKFECTLSLEKAVDESDVIIIIIPTLIDKYRNPELQPVIKLINSIGAYMKPGKLIVIESTVPPLTTEQIVKKQLEQISGLKAGKDFGLGFAPERTYSGRAIEDIRDKYPKIVGGVDPKSTERIALLYETIAKKGVIQMSSATAAEAVKIFKGIYRDVNIALANEFAKISEKIGVNVHEVIKAANSEPFSHIHRPGAGVGGHCIPVYPQFLINIANQFGINAELTKKGREINLSMPYHVINRTIIALNKVNKNLKGSKITLLGLAYRGNVKEYRYSPTFDVIKGLKEYEAKIVLHDPLYKEEELREIIDIDFEEDLKKAIQNSDCIVILTDHSEYKELDITFFDEQANNPYAIVDTRHILSDISERENTKRVIVGIGE